MVYSQASFQKCKTTLPFLAFLPVPMPPSFLQNLSHHPIFPGAHTYKISVALSS